MALDSEAESHSDAGFRSMRKMQGAAAAVIANDILAICHGVGVGLSRAQPGQGETLPK